MIAAMTMSGSLVSGFDVNKRKERFSFIANGNRCIWAELAIKSRDVVFVLGVPSSPTSFSIRQPFLSKPLHVMNSRAALFQHLFISSHHPGSSCFLRMVS